MAIDILHKDYEENALLALRIIFDLHKNYRPHLADYVQQFLDFASICYRTLANSCSQRNFIFSALQQPSDKQPQHLQNMRLGQIGSPTNQVAQTQHASTKNIIPFQTNFTVKAMCSFQVLGELPQTIVLLFQLYPQCIKTNLMQLLPLMMDALNQRPPPYSASILHMSTSISTLSPMPTQPPSPVTPSSDFNNEAIPPSPLSSSLLASQGGGQEHKSQTLLIQKLYYKRSRELLSSQVKAVSFLTHVLRHLPGGSDLMKPYEDHFATSILNLFTICPREAALTTRKELLISLRHIVTTDFRQGFFRHVDTLLDERVLIGKHRSSDHSSLRALAYSVLADILQYLRGSLSMVQTCRVVHLYSRVLHDASMNLPLTLEIQSVRLMLNLVEPVYNNKEEKASLGRDLLFRILGALVGKLGTLVEYRIEKVKRLEEKRKKEDVRIGDGMCIALDFCPTTTMMEHDHADADADADADTNTVAGTVMDDIVSEGKGKKKEVKKKRTFESYQSEKNGQKRRDQMYGSCTVQNMDTVQNVRDLIKPILTGMKTLIWCINTYGANREKNSKARDEKGGSGTKDIRSNAEVVTGATPRPKYPGTWYEEIALQKINVAERAVIEKYIVWSLKAIVVFKTDDSQEENNDQQNDGNKLTASPPPHQSCQQYRDALELFALSLSTLDPFNFQLIVGPQLNLLIEAQVEDEDVIFVAKKFLINSQGISAVFTSGLLKLLLEKMGNLPPWPQNTLGDGTEATLVDSEQRHHRKTAVIRRLFESIFSSLLKFPKNEAALRPHLQPLISMCLRHAMDSDADSWPGNSFTLLQHLCRAIAEGKFEESYKEILPLLPPLLNGMYRIYTATDHEKARHVIIEVCLTVPARLSSLLPHLPLLLRVIVPALQTNSLELVNLGLRTLEFWVDNLNPEYLFPILSHDPSLYSELMISVTNHLRPAPYQYGLLTLRLLGKLGGKNRLFLQEPMDFSSERKQFEGPNLSIECAWIQSKDKSGVGKSTECGENVSSQKVDDEKMDCCDGEADWHNVHSKLDDAPFVIPLPIKRARDVLELLSNIKIQETCSSNDHDEDIRSALLEDTNIEDFDLVAFKARLMNSTAQDQAKSAFIVLRSALAAITHIEEDLTERIVLCGDDRPGCESQEDKFPTNRDGNSGSESSLYIKSGKNKLLKLIGEGLFIATQIDMLRKEAKILLEGLATHMILVVASSPGDVVRVGTKGNTAGNLPINRPKEDISAQESSVSGAKLQPSLLFGCFAFSGYLKSDINYLVMNEVIAEILAKGHPGTTKSALLVISHIHNLVKSIDAKSVSKDVDKKEKDSKHILRCTDIFFESMVYELCQACLLHDWNKRAGLYDGICNIIGLTSRKLRHKFEVELMHVAFFCLKDYPDEVFRAGKEALNFFLRIIYLLYGGNTVSAGLIRDVLSLPEDLSMSKSTFAESGKGHAKITHNESLLPTSESIPDMLVGELCSSNQIVRFAARHGLEQIYGDEVSEKTNFLSELLIKRTSSIKRLIFARSLRNIPLSDQVATIETFAYIVNKAPTLVPISDNIVIIFLSELLKMMTVADGEMESESISNAVIINKDGYSPVPERTDSTIGKSSYLSHATGIYLRDECIMDGEYLCGRILVPAELPLGIQFRVSSLILFRSTINAHTNAFFNADTNTSIGNILPHIVSLLFRSLTSRPEPAVIAAHAALRDVLSLTARNVEGTRGSHRLPRNLLQTCIRPVLLNLRDYTKLSIPLLRGLSRLLTLLSSWFSKSLGEKLIDHLQKWGDVEKIISHNIWRRGEEPFVAAAIIELFELLPDDASQFVEPLVKTTLKLESVLQRYGPSFTTSPYRDPLAKYLNKHGSAVATFFINEHRLKNPIYSDLLQDIIGRKVSKDLRSQLSSVNCSNMLLTVCFERPLAIIKSDRGNSSVGMGSSSRSQSSNSSTRNPAETLSMHGINVEQAGKRQKENTLRQDLEIKQSKLLKAKHDAKVTEELQNRLTTSSTPGTPDNLKALSDAMRQHKKHAIAVENIQKQVDIARKEHNGERAKLSRNDGDSSRQTVRSMSLDALELQYQGFTVVETLILNDRNYISEHHDVVRAFRWLWRSRGRHLRLLHEDSMPPRYSGESTILAQFLVNYSKTRPDDGEQLFDLLRIFLQPTTTDFSFVKLYLKNMVCNVLTLEQKKRVMQRFFSHLASTGIEETKVLAIQLLILPMLKNDFEVAYCPPHANAIETSIISQSDATTRMEANNIPNDRKERTHLVLGEQLISRFVAEVLLHGGKSRIFGNRLSVELLKLSSILLEFMWKETAKHQQDLIKFAWNLLRNEDLNTKHWAYITVCQFIAVYDTPSKVIVQVYAALLRCYQQEAKELVCIALDILIPVLGKRLSVEEYTKAIKYTVKILHEEGNCLPQLSHMCHTIVRHKSTFYRHKDEFAPYLVASLNKLGFSSIENREFSLSLIELLLHWEGTHPTRICDGYLRTSGVKGNSSILKRNEVSNDYVLEDSAHIFASLGSPESSPRKKVKLSEAVHSVTSLVEEKQLPPLKVTQDNFFTLEQSEINTVVNFVVRFVLQTAVGDTSAQRLGKKGITLFRHVVSRWKSEIQAVYFDKVVSMCVSETNGCNVPVTPTAYSRGSGIEKKLKEKETKAKGCGRLDGKPSSGKFLTNHKGVTSKLSMASLPTHPSMLPKKTDVPKPVSSLLLSTCLELFIHILECAPDNTFFLENSDKVYNILRPCFMRASIEAHSDIREKLSTFLVLIFSHGTQRKKSNLDLLESAKVLLESSIMPLVDSEDSLEANDRTESELTVDLLQSANFALHTIEEISKLQPEFVQSFVGTLVMLAMRVAKDNVKPVSSKTRNSTTALYPCVSPLVAVFEEVCKNEDTLSMDGTSQRNTSSLSKEQGILLKSENESAPELDCLICCLRLIGNSSIPFYFTENRKNFLKILSDILDTSTNIHLLLAATTQVGRWLSKDQKGGPLTRKESKSFIGKLTALDSRGLCEIETQPLSHVVCVIILSLQGADLNRNEPQSSFVTETRQSIPTEVYGIHLAKVTHLDAKIPEKNKLGDHNSNYSHHCDQVAVLQRALVGCLLTTNLKMRPIISGLFATGLNNVSQLESNLMEIGKAIGCRSSDALDCAGIPHQSVFEMLFKLLGSDFEGLGCRLWNFVFVDMLLAISHHSGGIRMATDKRNVEPVLSKSSISDPFMCRANANCWIAPPNFSSHSHSGNTEGDLPFISLEDVGHQYTTFRQFLLTEKRTNMAGRGRCLAAVRCLARCDTSMCQELMEHIMPIAWSLLPSNSARLSLIPLLENLLSRPFHSQFLKVPVKTKLCPNLSVVRSRETNAIQPLLSTLARLQPLPLINVEVLISLATDYSCWHEVRGILEAHLLALDNSPDVKVRVYESILSSAVRRCYLDLGERDIWLTMKSKCCKFPGTKRAVSLDMYGQVDNALSAYSGMVDKVESSQEAFNSGMINPPTEEEICFWEDRWVALHRELCQWAVLTDFAEDSGCSKLMMDCAWKNRDWEKVRSLCSSPSIVAALENGDFEVKMSEIFLAIADGKLTEVENLHAQTAQLCLYKWRLLPSVFSGCNAHTSLLHHFHRLIDLKESGQIMVEASKHPIPHANEKTCPDLKNLLSAWRYRLPNDFDLISYWEDIFQWRFHMFTAITSKFHWAEQLVLSQLNDRPWTAIRMAQTARKQGLQDVARLSLGKLTDCAIGVSDAFSKLREQILSYRHGSDAQRTGGLNLVNTTNMSFFTANQKGELFRLKAEFLESLGGKTKATGAYCHSVQICPTYARTWTSWGGLCWSQAELIEKQSKLQSKGKREDTEKVTSNAMKVGQYLAQSMGCYLEAIQCESSDKYRVYLPRCLLMLSKDGKAPGLLCSTFGKYARLLPSWVWLTWIPQLLTSLSRIEAKTAKVILEGVISSYPQAIYFPLRAFYLERRDIERSHPSASGTICVNYTEELMTKLRKTHPTLWISLETILEEFILRFRPSYEEELLATVTALLLRAESQLEQIRHSSNGKGSDEDAVRASFSRTLERVSTKFFRSQSDCSSPPKDDRAKKTAEFSHRYKEAFEIDFSMNVIAGKGTNRLTLTDIISKLKKWKRILEIQVSSIPPVLPLMQISPLLSSFSFSVPDLWPGACDPHCITPPSTRKRKSDNESVSNQSSPSASAAAAMATAAAAARSVASASVYEGGGGYFGGGSASVEIPGQYSPNIMNDSKPSPELHSKLVKYSSTVEVSRRNEQLVRRIGMIGSHGKVHEFLLQFAIPYYTRTDERTAQLHQLFGRVLRKEAISSRRNLWLKNTPIIPIAQRLRMTAEEKCHISIEDIYIKDCHRKSIDPNAISQLFIEQSKHEKNSMDGQSKALTPDNFEAEGKAKKLDAYHAVCKMVDSRILSRYIQDVMGSSERYFQFQRTLTAQVALNSLLQYALDVNERIPSKFVLSTRNAQVLSPDFRFSYSNQGFLEENRPVPFRLTRNIETFIGPHLLSGVFIPAMTSAASAILANQSDLDPALSLLFRDDIISWYVSKSAQREGSIRSTQDLERQLADRVTRNVSLVKGRLRKCAPVDSDSKDDNQDPNLPTDEGARQLVAIATSSENIAQMSVSYCPWL